LSRSRFSCLIIVSSSSVFFFSTYFCQSSSTEAWISREAINSLMRSFLLRNSTLESMALLMSTRISRFLMWSSWYFLTRLKI